MLDYLLGAVLVAFSKNLFVRKTFVVGNRQERPNSSDQIKDLVAPPGTPTVLEINSRSVSVLEKTPSFTVTNFGAVPAGSSPDKLVTVRTMPPGLIGIDLKNSGGQ